MAQHEEHYEVPLFISCMHCIGTDEYTEMHVEHMKALDSGSPSDQKGIMPNVGLVGAKPVQPYNPTMGGSGQSSSATRAFNGLEVPAAHKAKTWADGSRYEGQWANGKAHNYGKMRHADGDEYEGLWLDGVAHGQGVYKSKNGTIFQGQWAEDMKEGQGVETWPDGARYEGMYSQGRKNGDGTFVWPNGSSYFGQLKDDEFDGEGSYHAADGRHYVGMWKKGKMSGKGCYRFPDGRAYEGEYRDSLRHGQGTFTWEDGRRYVGQWEKDQEHGRGTWISPKGDRKEGIWRNGSIYKWDDGNSVSGVNPTPLPGMAGSMTGQSTRGGTSANSSVGVAQKGNQQKGNQADQLPPVDPGPCYKAFNEAVMPQMVDFKNHRGHQLVSALSGKPLKFEDAVVQHAPISLEDLVNGFLKDENTKLEQVKIQKKSRNEYVLEDQSFLQKWSMYHLVHAHYRMVSAAEARASPT